MPTVEKTPLANNAVLPDSFPLAISLVVQKEIVDSDIMTYVSKPPISVHVPNSAAVSCLVTINVKAIPVITLTNPTARAINPE